MTDRDAILRAILTEPDNDDHRLAFAAWCHDDGDQPERAEFVRVQVELARKSNCKTCSGKRWYSVDDGPHGSEDCIYCTAELRRRERELWEEIGVALFNSSGFIFDNATVKVPITNGFFIKSNGGKRSRELHWYRGLIASLTLSWQDWLSYHERLYWHPEQKMECPWCRGSKMYWPAGRELGGASPPWETCSCGTGRIPRPFVAMAQPLESVQLTTYSWHEDGFGDAMFTREKCPTCSGTGMHRYYPDISGEPNYSDSVTCGQCHGNPLNSWTCPAWPRLRFAMPETNPIRDVGTAVRRLREVMGRTVPTVSAEDV